MTVCYFPGREKGYSRNRVLIRGMKAAGINVYDCSCSFKSIFRYFFGFIKFLKYKSRSDVIFIGFLGQFLVPVIRLFTRKPIIFDAFLSIYQTLAFDRKLISPHGIIAPLAKFLDSYSCQLADKVFLDTQQHIDFFVEEYQLPKDKFSRLWVGSDDSVMYPRPENESGEFLVHFHGEFQALHGTEYIVEAAKLLPDIKFQMIGKGRDLKKCLEKVENEKIQNINFIPSVPYEKLPEYMSRASICLGIFGNTQKTQMVIPHKVYEALAMKKPVITADTPAVRELLTHGEDVILCQAADPKNLMESIRRLKKFDNERNKIADRGYKVFCKNVSPSIIAQHIISICQKLA